MGTARIVETVLGNQKSLHDLAALQVAFNDFVDVGQLDISIPGAGGIDDDAGAVFALVQAATAIGTHRRTEAASLQGAFEGCPKKLGTLGIAAAARMALVTLIPTNEEMMSVFRHRYTGSGPSGPARESSRISFSAPAVNLLSRAETVASPGGLSRMIHKFSTAA